MYPIKLTISIILSACALPSVFPACAATDTVAQGDDDSSSDSDSDSDSDTDGDSDSDVDACPYDCVSAGLCAELDGTEYEDLVCDDDVEVCCDLGADTDTDADTDADSDTDIDSDGDSDSDTDACPFTCVSNETMCTLIEGTVDSGYECPDPSDVCCDTSTSCTLDELETFDGNIPAGWTVVDGGTSAGAWEWTDELPPAFPASFSSDGGVFIDSQSAGAGSIQDDDLESPLYDLGGCSSAILSYDYNFQKDTYGSDTGEVYVVPGGTDTPVLIVTHAADSPLNSLVSHTVPITSDEIGDETSFTVIFHYEGANDLGWYVDNVAVEGVP